MWNITKNTLSCIPKNVRSIKFRYGPTKNLKTTSTDFVQNNSTTEPLHPGLKEMKWVNELNYFKEQKYDILPIYRVLNHSGEIIQETENPNLPKNTLVKMYQKMVLLANMDIILFESQRQGRISFYMTNTGEEGVQIGCVAALNFDDLVFAQYRETGILMYRGYTVQNCLDQCTGNIDDKCTKGRQMPVHYGSKELNYVVVSSPLATQIPQAVGAAYTFKIQKLDKISCVFCGDGSASEGDFHAGLNFAATLNAPVIFVCRNNGYAISTKVNEQYAGDGIAARAPGYGIHVIRVDGNDIFAVYNVIKYAREYALKHNKPVFIEAMTYRVGHHSTSDDSLAYRDANEIEQWSEKGIVGGPIKRLRKYLEKKNFWDDETEKKYQTECRKNILSALTKAENKLKPNWREMFGDVYHKMPEHLREQMKEMENHLKKYEKYYPVDQHAK
ncbi:2-oxoisovalerate dehydrogenase subunit alpha, mitochondrial [Chrysoperla carnea]|uniref:2-oxoisovalerate dehydrogenase subunit alpha, mitochondrial n=1 Tax=Chrysoperla carnea TaxID=189513 RepID=UPI001D083251|nr:2-oxoisovalerate dehydrogenase subunit alpha, mitochondrial [Chrysoperla carnea]